MMFRVSAITLLAMAAAGCSTQDTVVQASRSARDSVVQAPQDACLAVADQRATDAGLNGYDRDMRQRIYAYTYQDCEKFQSR